MAPPRAVVGTNQQSKRVPVSQQDDKHMQHGKLLLSLQQAPSSLERMLAVSKLCVTVLADLMRRSDDTQDIPLLILGHHYISHRVLSDPKASPASAAASAPATAPPTSAAGTASGEPAAAAAAGPADVWRVHVQELCTFDAHEGPKSFVGVQGVPQASCAISLEPYAVAKAKRLGRDLSIKLTLQPPSGSSGSNGGSSGSSVRLVGCGEDYVIAWPSMVFLDPISPACKLAYKGDLEVSCPQTGLFLSLTFAKDHSVKGSLEQLTPTQPPPAPAAAADSSSTSSSSSGGGNGLVGSSSKGKAGGVAGKPQVVGSLEGSWMGTINIICPQLGLEGLQYDVKEVNPAPVPCVDLRHMGPMRVSRFWSAVHDALLYADPRAAAGGRAAMKLASTMGHYLTALTLDSAAARDLAGSTAQGATSTAGASRTAASVVSVNTDPDLDEFDRQAEGLSSGKLDASQDTRDVPPCYKEQHAQGNKLRYQLHYTLTLS